MDRTPHVYLIPGFLGFHVDWLVTGSGFDGARFEALWGDVTGFLTAGADATKVPASVARMSRHARGAIALARET